MFWAESNLDKVEIRLRQKNSGGGKETKVRKTETGLARKDSMEAKERIRCREKVKEKGKTHPARMG